MNKTRSYLHKKLDSLMDEKSILSAKNNELDIQIERIQNKINELKKNIDDSFEVFSPRSKKNDFTKNEIEVFQERKEALSQLREERNGTINLISEEIADIHNALKELDETEIKAQADEEHKDMREVIISGINIVKEQEYERKRIAMELHDSTVQVLTNLVHKCEICSKVMDVDMVRSKLELEVMAKTLREAINELRQIIYNIRPMSFDDMGLDVTVERIVNQAKRESDININLTIEGERRSIGEIQSISIVRILQEAIINGKKYSHGKNINIILKYTEDGIYLQVWDDGKGFDATKIKKPEDNNLSGFGLSMMKERVYLLNGTINIESKENEGTKITVNIPNGSIIQCT